MPTRMEYEPTIDDDETPACPICGELTGSLKQYRCLDWCVFLLAGAIWRVAFVRACPSCMRSFLLRRAVINIPLANLLWPFLMIWSAALYASTYREGHSRAVRTGVTPQAEAAREARDQEVSWGRVLAIVAVLFCWVPILGLPIALLAFWINRKSATWLRLASIAALGICGIVHLLLLTLILLDEAKR